MVFRESPRESLAYCLPGRKVASGTIRWSQRPTPDVPSGGAQVSPTGDFQRSDDPLRLPRCDSWTWWQRAGRIDRHRGPFHGQATAGASASLLVSLVHDCRFLGPRSDGRQRPRSGYRDTPAGTASGVTDPGGRVPEPAPTAPAAEGANPARQSRRPPSRWERQLQLATPAARDAPVPRRGRQLVLAVGTDLPAAQGESSDPAAPFPLLSSVGHRCDDTQAVDLGKLG